MIAVRVYEPGGKASEVESGQISRSVGKDECLLWVDVSDPTEDDLSCLEQEFALHPLALEDVRNRHQRPKLEHYPTHAFLVAYTNDLQEVDFFIGPNWVVSVREAEEGHEAWSTETARLRFERTRPDPPTPGFLLYTLLDDLVDGYFIATEKSEDELEDLEERIFAEELPDEESVQQELFNVRRRLVLFRRAVVPLREVLSSLLRGEVKWIDEHTRTYLQDVYDHVLRAVDQVDAQRELMGNAVDAHLAIISNRMNSVMERMTAWGAILLGATLVAGIYGMNFETIPELRWDLGYLWALGLMVTITVVGYRYFRRKGWL
ncbi:MAG: magnesium/cobalt transporter CorA [Actinomycetota bacterium]|nr:magnesium/cobalt transporter CorA [Actinomycetota bacterium]